MKRPSAASLKRVNVENLASLGAPRLAELLLAVADSRPELKRRLRMELAAEQGVEHLAAEVDKRLTSLETLATKVSWRQRPIFLRDLDALRRLIAERMAGLDRAAALERMWRLMNLAKKVALRVRDKHGELDALFENAAGDLGRLLRGEGVAWSADALAEAIRLNPKGWSLWLPIVLDGAPVDLAASALKALAGTGEIHLIRQLADAADDIDAYRATFPDKALKDPAHAAAIARRLLAGGRIEEAGAVLKAAGPVVGAKTPPHFDWETVWIDYLDHIGQAASAQAARWSSFERTLSLERAKAFTRRLKDFEDVEAETRAFAFAAAHPDVPQALTFLMAWPAVAEAGRLIEARPDDVRATPEQAELWAPQLQRTKPRAALILLRKAAAEAFRRRAFAACDRLTAEAEALDLANPDD